MTLERRTQLKRTFFKPSAPKPVKGPKPKKCQNKECRQPYMPDPKQPFKVWCSDDCGTAIALARLAKQKAAKAKAERAADLKKKREHKTTAELADPVRKLVQRYAVLRDHDYGCISCDKGAYWTGGKWHGSHFKSVGSNSALQFNLLNVHKACDQCNFFQAGNIANYETRLRQKIGNDKVDWLKNHSRSRDYSVEYLDRLSAILRKKIRRIEKRLGIR